jgi:ribosome biogenesis GTPase A
MNQARRKLRTLLRRSDMVLEVLDARLPLSSQNPLLSEIRGNMPCLRVLTKPDLADRALTEQWLTALSSEGVSALAVEATQPKAVKRLVHECRKLVPHRGDAAFPVRVLITGIPNVGKSTLFNSLAGSRKAEVRDQPAVTRRDQYIAIEGGIALVDTPGILWPKLDDQDVALRLAMSGAIRDAVVDSVLVARFAIQFLCAEHPLALKTRFKLNALSDDPDQVLEAIAERRGCLTKGIGADLTKASELLLNEMRSGKLGNLTFERPATIVSS